MADRLKILDCNRKAILTMPAPAFQLWMCYYMNEDEIHESYLTLDEIEEQLDMRMSRRSIITWTQWLVRAKWLVIVEGKSAADKWIERGRTATRGAYQIKVYRVDDPTSAKSAPEETIIETDKTSSSAKSAPVQIAHKVSSSGSGFGSNSGSKASSAFISSKDSLSSSSAFGGGCANADSNADAKPEPKPKTGKPRPPKDFDSWSLEKRLAWSESNKTKTTGEGNAAAASPSSLSSKPERRLPQQDVFDELAAEDRLLREDPATL